MGTRWLLWVVVCGCTEPAPSPKTPQFGAGFGDREHEPITEDGLGFLRSTVVDDIRDEHADFADVDDSSAAAAPWMHFDGCAFGESIQQINAFYADAVANLAPGATLEPWSATDDFGRALHPIQDFYAHSNWVELGFPATPNDPGTSWIDVASSDLVDFGTRTGLGPWQMPTRRIGSPDRGLDHVRDDILVVDMVDTPLGNANNTGELDLVGEPTARSFELAWQFGLLPHPTNAGLPGFVPAVDVHGAASYMYVAAESGDGLPIPVMTSGEDYRLLITGVGGRPITSLPGNGCDPFRRDAAGAVIQPPEINTCTNPDDEPDDYSCIAYHGSRFALTHSGSARSELNKDRESSAPTRFPKARALAVLQTQYEWCRLVKQAGDQGGDGVLLSLWVEEGRSPNPPNTPCAGDDGRGPYGVTVTIDDIEILDDKDNDDDAPGELNLSLAVYDHPSAFHRIRKSKVGPFDATEGDVLAPGLAPATQCVGRADHTFRVALHGWDDDDGLFGANGDFDQHGTSPGSANVDDVIIGFTDTIDASTIPIGGPLTHRHTTSSDLRVTYHVTRTPDADADGLDTCGEDYYGTSPLLADTDGDFLRDGIEVEGDNPTNPLVADSDGDALLDGEEDADHDGTLDANETDPNASDTDGDALPDGIEVHGANPTNPVDDDTDADGLPDGQEDADHDGTLDAGETNPNDGDSDDDGLGDGLEIAAGTHPLDPDSDDDGVIDGEDPDLIATAVTALPAVAFKNASHRHVIIQHLDSAEKQIEKGNLAAARAKLLALRQHIDGCGAASDPDDWIVDCVTQTQIRALLDIVLANL